MYCSAPAPDNPAPLAPDAMVDCSQPGRDLRGPCGSGLPRAAAVETIWHAGRALKRVGRCWPRSVRLLWQRCSRACRLSSSSIKRFLPACLCGWRRCSWCQSCHRSCAAPRRSILARSSMPAAAGVVEADAAAPACERQAGACRREGHGCHARRRHLHLHAQGMQRCACQRRRRCRSSTCQWLP